MATVLFVGLDGTENSYRLQTHRPFTVGRDPGNDIVLRDPKASRHHAEIVFERGFFVMHDLASANGTFVNGKRVRIAPLTDGTTIRIGNSHGRYAEESDEEPQDEVPQPLQLDEDATFVPRLDSPELKLDTVPHERLDADVKKN